MTLKDEKQCSRTNVSKICLLMKEGPRVYSWELEKQVRETGIERNKLESELRDRTSKHPTLLNKGLK
jgi:hypothetical protein